MYGPVLNEPYPVAAVDLRRVDPKFWRQQVVYDTPEPAGTIVVDVQQRFAIPCSAMARQFAMGSASDARKA